MAQTPGPDAREAADAELSAHPAADGQTINYVFPVEVVVVGSLSEAQMLSVAEYVFGELNSALGTQA